MVADVYAALQGFKSILDSLKAMSDIRDEKMRNEASIGLTRDLIDLQSKMVGSLQKQAMLIERVRMLEAEIVQLQTRQNDLDRYELKTLANGGSVYMLTPEARGTEPPHWLCPNCYANSKKSIFQFGVQASMGDVYRCSTCKAHMTTHEKPEWIGDVPTALDTREVCRFCRKGRLDLIDSKPHRIFGDLGTKTDTLKCDNPACGKTEEREYDPPGRQ